MIVKLRSDATGSSATVGRLRESMGLAESKHASEAQPAEPKPSHRQRTLLIGCGVAAGLSLIGIGLLFAAQALFVTSWPEWLWVLLRGLVTVISVCVARHLLRSRGLLSGTNL